MERCLATSWASFHFVYRFPIKAIDFTHESAYSKHGRKRYRKSPTGNRREYGSDKRPEFSKLLIVSPFAATLHKDSASTWFDATLPYEPN